jgi:hypothetical protein
VLDIAHHSGCGVLIGLRHNGRTARFCVVWTRIVDERAARPMSPCSAWNPKCALGRRRIREADDCRSMSVIAFQPLAAIARSSRNRVVLAEPLPSCAITRIRKSQEDRKPFYEPA